VYYGRVSVDSEALVGKTVHYPARVMQHGKSNEFWLSDSAEEFLEKESPDLAHSIKWLKSEKCDLKGFEKKQKLWRVA
jgi:class 3 adenylate cyclase